MTHPCKKLPSDGRTDGQTDRLTDNRDFLRPSVGRGSNRTSAFHSPYDSLNAC